MSGWPVTTTTVPSSLTLTVALDFTAGVEPEAAGDAAALVWTRAAPCSAGGSSAPPASRRSRSAESQAVGRLGSLLGRVLLAQLERIHLQSAGQFVEDAFHREGTDRRTRGAVGRDLRPVADHIEAGDLDVGDVVGRKRACRRHRDGRAGKAPACRRQVAFTAVILPSLVAPILTVLEEPDVGPVARNTSSRVITILTGRPDLRASTIASGSR